MTVHLPYISTPIRVSQGLAVAICVGFGVALVVANLPSWGLEDSNAYWNAALRLREGADLYPPLADPNAPDVYRYAPWFAWLWVPLTFLPKGAVMACWSVTLVGSAVAAIFPLVRVRSVASVCVAALLGGLMIRTASTGNVHAMLIAILVIGLPRRSGPLWIGIAASLKLAPIAYAFVYLGRREWRQAATALLVAGVLTAPALLYDLSHYPSDTGSSFSLLALAGPVPWALVAIGAAGVAILAARGPFRWAAASVSVLATIPRLELYDLTYLLAGLGGRADQRHGRSHADG